MKERPTAHHPSPFRAEVPTPIDRHREVLDRLEQAVGEIHDSDSFRRYLDVQARFHHYSWGNAALILARRPDATRVAGYRTWQALGRQVRKGEQAITIVVPRITRDADAPEDADKRRVSFAIGNVFDLSQTEGDPLPGLTVPVLESDDGGLLYDELARLAGRGNIRVSLVDTFPTPEQMGSYDPLGRRIRVREHVPQLQRTKTLAHELAHHYTGHTETYGAFRDEHETIAESVAYVVLAHFGLDSGERSFPYIATWSKDRATLKQVLGTIQGVAGMIISSIEAQYGVPTAPLDQDP